MEEQINTKDIKNLKVVLIDKATDPNVTQKDCVYQLLIEYADGTNGIVSAEAMNDIKGRQNMTKLFSQCLSANSFTLNKQNGVLKDSEDLQFFKASNSKSLELYEQYRDSLNDNVDNNGKSRLTTAMALTGLGIVVTAGAVAGVTYARNHQAEPVTEETQEEVNDEIAKPSMDGQDWDYYTENAIDSIQKEAWTKVGTWLLEFNNSQSWMTRTNNNGQESRFGFTPEETMAFYLRFNNFTDEELITICNGSNINADEIMDLSNDFMEKMNLYYSLSNQTSNISSLFNDEHDKEVINTFEEHHAKMMSTGINEKETLMQAEKEMYKDYFNSDIEGKETKARAGSTSYLLRTMLPADQREADLRNYKDKMIIYTTGTAKEVEVKVDLFDEVFMSRYVQGFAEFDENHFLKQLGYNPEKYYLGIDGTKESIADLSCGEQEEKFRDADEYRVNLETSDKMVEDNKQALKAQLTVYTDEDGKIDADKVAEAVSNMNFDNEDAVIGELTKYTYDNDLIASMLNQKLESLTKNEMYSNTFWEKVTETALQELSKIGGSDKAYSSKLQEILETSNTAAAKDSLVANGNTPAEAEAGIIKSEEDASKAVGSERDTDATKQKHEQIAKQEKAALQVDYNDVFNYFASGNTGEMTKYSTSTDANVKNRYEKAKKDGLDNLYKNVYANTYNYYNQGGTDEYNSSYASSANSTIRSAYSQGKSDGQADYQKRMQEANKVPDYVQPGTITTDPTGNNGTIDDVINKGNSEDSNKDVPTPEPVITPQPTTEPTVEPTPDVTPTPDVNPTPTPDYAPIVDGNITPPNATYFDEDELIKQFEQQSSYSEDLQAMDSVDQVVEESVQKTR